MMQESCLHFFADKIFKMKLQGSVFHSFGLVIKVFLPIFDTHSQTFYSPDHKFIMHD